METILMTALEKYCKMCQGLIADIGKLISTVEVFLVVYIQSTLKSFQPGDFQNQHFQFN